MTFYKFSVTAYVMEDNNTNNYALEDTTLEDQTNECKAETLQDNTQQVVQTPQIDNSSETLEPIIHDDVRQKDSSLKEWYQYYKNSSSKVENVSCVNARTVTGFIVLILMCIATFIGCIAIDLSSPKEASSSGTTSTNDDDSDSSAEDDGDMDYDLSSNSTLNVQQFDTPTREDSTYLNDDGTYTVAGVAKYASDSVIAVYVSSDGINLDGMGSGIVFSDEGYVLTNAHVVEDANYIIGILPDETQVNLSFVGMDTELDIAVLQSDNCDIPVATMGNSDDVILGEDVVAIGNPAGLTGTVTKGIVSSIDRAYTTSDDVERSYIQTDTAISPGNSGGALLNMYGQVIGITTMKISEDETYEGLGFAICINDALECAERLIKNRFRIGITFNLQNSEIEISGIDSSCDVANTELQEGDVITEINDDKVYDYSSVMNALEGSKPGDSVTAKVERRSKDGLRSEFYIQFKLMPYGS